MRVLLTDTHYGRVSEVMGEQVEVTYETAQGPIRQIYDRNQFNGGEMPNEGDNIEVKVTVSVA